MDINTNVSQQAAAPLLPFKAGSSKMSVDSPAQPEVDAASKADIRLAGVSVAKESSKVKEAKDDADLEQAVDKLNGYIQNVQRNLQFSIDKDSGAMVVKVIDSKSEKVIRQIPTEETLRLARSLAEDKEDVAFNIFSSRA